MSKFFVSQSPLFQKVTDVTFVSTHTELAPVWPVWGRSFRVCLACVAGARLERGLHTLRVCSP